MDINLKQRRQRISRIPIVEIAKKLKYTPVVVGRNYLSLKEHDSVRINIKDNTFQRWSNKGWGDTTAFLMEFASEKDKRFKSLNYAIFYLEKMLKQDQYYDSSEFEEKNIELIKKELKLPLMDSDNSQVIRHLKNDRAIKDWVINYFIENKMLYQESGSSKNCVFVSYEDSIPIFAFRKSSKKEYRFYQDIPGSNYDFCFYINNYSDTIVVTESVVDMMSLMSLKENDGQFNKSNFLALNGVRKYRALLNILANTKNIESVILALDNDKAAHEVIQEIRDQIHNKYKHIHTFTHLPETQGADWNDVLRTTKEGEIVNERGNNN